MQFLVFVYVVVGDVVYCCDGVCVVCGEYWVDCIGMGEQLFGVGQVGYVGVLFVGEYWVVWIVFDLCVFDFGILVGVFDQVYLQVVIGVVCYVGQVVDCVWCVFLVGLYDYVEVVLVGQ